MIGFYLTSCFAVMTMVEPSTLTSSSSGLKKIGLQAHFFLVINLTCSSLHQGRFGICHRRRTPGNTHLCINMSSHALKGLSPNLWMWKPIRVLGLLWLLEDSSIAPVALLFHLVEVLVNNKWISSCGSGGGQQQDLRVDQRQDTSRMVMN